MHRSIHIGFDTPNGDAFAVCRHSLYRYMSRQVPIAGIELAEMRRRGLYTREVERRHRADGSSVLWDPISGAAMSTEFSISRFLTPFLANWRGWALFMDCDILALTDVSQLFDLLDPSKAVMCVQHDYQPPEGVKMDGQLQQRYSRKNWSSVMAFNCEHQGNARLTLEMINTLPGRDLHRFCWLEDSQIGALPPEWNWLVGHSSPTITPALVHYTEGGPWLEAYADVPFADEWRRERSLWVAGGTWL